MCLTWFCYSLNISRSDSSNNNSNNANNSSSNKANQNNNNGNNGITTNNNNSSSGDRRSSNAAASGGTKQNVANFLDHVTPGAFSFITQMHNPKSLSEELTLDLNELKKQYKKLKERQRQAQIIIQTAAAQHRLKSNATAAAASSSSSTVASSSMAGANPNSNNSNPQASASSSSARGEMMMRNEAVGNRVVVDTSAMSPFSLEQTPIVNHLLIKPSDLTRNTLKQTIKLSSSAAPVTMAATSGSNSNELIIDPNLAEKISHSQVRFEL